MQEQQNDSATHGCIFTIILKTYQGIRRNSQIVSTAMQPPDQVMWNKFDHINCSHQETQLFSFLLLETVLSVKRKT